MVLKISITLVKIFKVYFSHNGFLTSVFVTAGNNVTVSVCRHYLVTVASWQQISMLGRFSARMHWQI